MILQRQKLNFSEVMSEMCIQGWWKQMLESGFVGWGVSSSLNCFLEAGVSWRAAGVLWGHLPLSLMPFLSSPNCDLRSPRHMCTSLEQGYSYHCLQEVCSVFSVFKQFIGNSIYYMATLKMQIIKLVFSIFPRTHERLAVISTKLEVEKEQNKSWLGVLSSRPVLEPPCVGNFNNPLVLKGNLTPRANVGFSFFFFFLLIFFSCLCVFF